MIIHDSNETNFENHFSTHSYSFKYPCSTTFPCHPIHITLPPGYYQFECWGAGYISSVRDFISKGAYTSGFLELKEERDFYIYIGSSPTEQWQRVYNGGGYNQISGSGATDVRLVPGEWDDFESLKSRIMVAGGGGGVDGHPAGNGVGIGGSTSAISNSVTVGGDANQTSGGEGLIPGKFGEGGGREHVIYDGSGSGGGGYYGGGSSPLESIGSGGGGSSYVSGHRYCDSISNESTSVDNITHLHSPFHYSGISFIKPMIIDGNSRMPSPNNSLEYVNGNEGNGIFKITQLTSLLFVKCGTQYPNKSFIEYIISLKTLFLLIILKH